MGTTLRVLIVEDSEDDAALLLLELRRGGYDPVYERVDTPEAMAAALDEQAWDLIVSDYVMPHFSGPAALGLLQEKGLDLPFIMVSGLIGEAIAVEAMKAGAHDYVMKDNLARLIPAIERELREAATRRDRRRAEQALKMGEARYRAIVEDQTELICRFLPGNILTFVNEAYCRCFDKKREELIGHNFLSLIPEEDHAEWEEHIASLGKEKSVATVEHRVVLPNGKIAWQQWTDRAIFDERGELVEFQSVGRDITEQKRAEEELQYRLQFEKLITGISTSFVNLWPEEVDRGINEALQAIGEFAGVDRSYVFLPSEDGKKANNTHEWCAEGIEPQIDKLRDLPYDDFPWWRDTLNRFEAVHVPHLADLPPEAEAEKRILQLQGVQSVVAVPMVSRGSLCGFVGFDSVRSEKTWSDESIALLRMVGEVFSSALERKRAEEEKRRLQEETEEATRRFYRETILAVTEGRLEICEADDMEQWIRDPDMVVPLLEFEDSPKSRDAARCFLDRYDVELEERDMWLLCIGEAVTNALKHVGHGKLLLGHREENVLWAAVVDEGQGIEALMIPKATLMAGFSTKPSLGMGYSIILSHAEIVRLSTGSNGTTVMMERHIGGDMPRSLPSLYEMPYTV